MKQQLLTILVVVSLGGAAYAYRPAPPPPLRVFQDRRNIAKLVITTQGWSISSVVLTQGKKTQRWRGAYEYPQKVHVSSAAKRVVFFGSYGGACIGLGEIKVYDFSGKLLQTLNGKGLVPNLEALSRRYTRICCPCFWVHALTESSDGKSLTINVCNQTRVTLALGSPALSK